MHFHVYQDAAGEWRWRLRANNGRTIADGAEGYASERNCNRAVQRVIRAIRTGS